MVHIVISANTSWYLYNFRRNTIKALLDDGYDVTAVAPVDEYSSKLEALGIKFISVRMDQGGTNPFRDLRTYFDFEKIYSSKKYDLVLNFTPKNNIYSTLAAKRNDMKVINNIAGLGVIFIKKSLVSSMVKHLYKFSQTKVDKIFFQNEDDKSLFIQYQLAREEATERLPGSGVDLMRFTNRPSPDDGVVRFLLIARMLYDKGIGLYVEAARRLKEKYGTKVEFNLLGFLAVNNPSAVTKEQMQAWVDEGIVNYLGVSDEVEEEIAKVDCMVLPSYYREGVPKSLLEAGGMGKPIITTDNVGCRETVDDGFNGYLCEPRSTDSLVDALDRMINHTHQERLQMGCNSRIKIEKEFDERVVIYKYLTAIKQLNENCV